MHSKEIRTAFIEFFEERDHRFVRSAPVIPIDDPTLLFTNAGMNQFKPIFLGEQDPEFKRVVNSQKCIRVSGKHNDLEEVGIDTFHHTFFEMLGNWSFGDYYKAEAIQWAWELFTAVWGLDKNRLWATVYEQDDEAFNLWPRVTDIDPARVLKFGKKENFWEMGETGPCGPCSEIHYFIGDNPADQAPAGVNHSDHYWELWNLVFIQNHCNKDGLLVDLPQKHVDTGAGLERIVTVLQQKTSNYETDLFQPLINRTENLTGKQFNRQPIPFQVIADHIRMLSFSIAEGGMPSNDGRGYVLRRILRRAARFGRMLGCREPFLFQLVETVGEIMGSVFPEVHEKRAHIENVIRAEEGSFNETLDRGLIHFEKIIANLSGNQIPGREAFKLYDTFGFPLDLTQLMAREKGLTVDQKGFEKEMQQQQQRAKAAGKFKRHTRDLSWKQLSAGNHSVFKGYESLVTKSRIRKYSFDGELILLILDKTPFYAESGGQTGDQGWINNDGLALEVIDVKKDGTTFIHYCQGDWNLEKAGESVECLVNESRRQKIRKNHTATHLMHAALKQVLGEHVQQAGSLVHPDYLRFDLTHFEKITSDQIQEVEKIVNREILLNTPLDISVKPFDAAREEGAVALFGEKYGDQVRVVTVENFSKELCGGTHVERTGDIGLFKIIEESSLAAGVRRIMAVTGPGAVKYVQNQSAILESIRTELNCSQDQLADRVHQLVEQRKLLERELKKRPEKENEVDVCKLMEQQVTTGNRSIVVSELELTSMTTLKETGDRLLQVLDSGVGVLGMKGTDKPAVVVVVSSDLVQLGIKAGDLAREIGAVMGGGGGGKAHLATAGGKDIELLQKALAASRKIIQSALQKI
ncbi:MAG: alanine--tRNA ligase [Fidelibacterota bacterium]